MKIKCDWPEKIQQAFDDVSEHIDLADEYMEELYKALENVKW